MVIVRQGFSAITRAFTTVSDRYFKRWCVCVYVCVCVCVYVCVPSIKKSEPSTLLKKRVTARVFLKILQKSLDLLCDRANVNGCFCI